MTKHDQIGQIGSGKEQRAGVGKQERSVEKGALATTSLTRRSNENRREEYHRRIEVECCRDDDNQECRSDEERGAVSGQSGELASRGMEQPVFFGNHPDNQQT